MKNEYYGAPTTPNDDYLAHYGVKGMKWGVRKAINSGNDRRLSRQFNKDMKKLQRLEKRAANGKKYIKRAAALGAGAAAAGGLAAAGTEGVSKAIGYGGKAFSKGTAGVGGLMTRIGGEMTNRGIRGGGRMRAAGNAISGLSKHNATGVAQRVSDWGNNGHDYLQIARNKALQSGHGGLAAKIEDFGNRHGLNGPISNNTVARVGAGALGAGLAAGAGYNAYRAATTKKAAAKAANWRKEMQKSYSGTRYANIPRNNGKRRRG